MGAPRGIKLCTKHTNFVHKLLHGYKVYARNVVRRRDVNNLPSATIRLRFYDITYLNNIVSKPLKALKIYVSSKKSYTRNGIRVAVVPFSKRADLYYLDNIRKRKRLLYL